MFEKLFGKKNKTTALDLKTVRVNVDKPYRNGWVYLDDTVLSELNGAPHYDRVEITVQHDQFVLKNLKPRNRDAEIVLIGGGHHMLLNNDLGSVRSFADDVQINKDDATTSLFAPKAKKVSVEDNAAQVTVFAPMVDTLEFRRACVQIGQDMPNLKAIQGGTVTGFVAPYTDSNVKGHIRQVGKLYFAPILDDTDWYHSFMTYNGHTKCFIGDSKHKNFALPDLTKTEEAPEALAKLKSDFAESIFVPHQRDKAWPIIDQFVDAIADIENPNKPAIKQRQIIRSGAGSVMG